jgi:hypothetical protein
MATSKKTRSRVSRATSLGERGVPQEACCCDPRALVWIDARTECCAVENRLEAQQRGPLGNTRKDQGKVYRTDVYTIHWKAEGQCQPLRIRLQVRGDVGYEAHCIPNEGQVTLSRAYMLEPPDYAFAKSTGFVSALLTVQDCARRSSRCENVVPRP